MGGGSLFSLLSLGIMLDQTFVDCGGTASPWRQDGHSSFRGISMLSECISAVNSKKKKKLKEYISYSRHVI